MKKTYLLLSALIFTLSTSLFASQQIWVVNKDHSELLLSIPYMSVSDVTARLKSFSGKIIFQDKEIESIDIKIKATSFDSNNGIRDGHVKSEDFLDTKKYPFIFFKSQQITRNGDSYKALGELTIKDVTKSFTIEFKLSTPIKDTWGHINRFVHFETSVNRKDFKVTWSKGINDNQILVGEDIALKANIQIQPIDDKTPTYKHMLPNTHYIQMSEKYQRGEITLEEFKEATKSKFTSYSKELDPPKEDSAENEEDMSDIQNTEKELSNFWKGLEYTPPPVRDGKWWVSFSTVSLIGTVSIALCFGFFYEMKKRDVVKKEGGIDLFVTLLLLAAFTVLVIYFTALKYLTE